MCANYIINGKTYSSLNELSKLIPLDKLKDLMDDVFCDDNLDSCLCCMCHEKLSEYLNEPCVRDAFDFIFGKDILNTPEDSICGFYGFGISDAPMNSKISYKENKKLFLNKVKELYNER